MQCPYSTANSQVKSSRDWREQIKNSSCNAFHIMVYSTAARIVSSQWLWAIFHVIKIRCHLIRNRVGVKIYCYDVVSFSSREKCHVSSNIILSIIILCKTSHKHDCYSMMDVTNSYKRLVRIIFLVELLVPMMLFSPYVPAAVWFK